MTDDLLAPPDGDLSFAEKAILQRMIEKRGPMHATHALTMLAFEARVLQRASGHLPSVVGSLVAKGHLQPDAPPDKKFHVKPYQPRNTARRYPA